MKIRHPIADEDWEAVKDAVLPVVNATLMDDDVLRTSQMGFLRDTMDGLIMKYGRHPWLLETLADFTDSSEEQLDLYDEARRAAATISEPSHSICIAAARLMLDEFRDTRRALEYLKIAENDIEEHGDCSEQKEYAELLSQVRPTKK